MQWRNRSLARQWTVMGTSLTGDGNILDMEGLTDMTGRLDGDGVESRPLLLHGDVADLAVEVCR